MDALPRLGTVYGRAAHWMQLRKICEFGSCHVIVTEREKGPSMGNSYEDRLLRVVSYIHDNPDGDLSLDALADVAAMSRFHWHRVYHAMTGETCKQTVKRIRLHRAACWLIHEDWSVAELSKRCGYSKVQSFTRAFSEAYGMPPSAFRNRGELKSPLLYNRKGEFSMYPVQIETRPGATLAALPHTGPYIEIGKVFEQVSAIFTSRNMWSKAKGMAGVYYDDPSATPENELRSHAGVVIEGDVPEGLETISLRKGKTAVLNYKGPYAGLKAAYDYMYGVWLPESREIPSDAPPYEVYINSPMDTAPDDLVTHICVPLE